MIGQIIGGLIVGVIARLIMPGKEVFPDGIVGWILTAILGIVGAVIGGFIARALWAPDNYSAGWIMSIVGAIVLLVIVRMIFGTKNTLS